MSESDEWYFDLQRGVAVPSSERGKADHMLGPYPTKGEAENWRSRSEARNDAWDDADEKWNQRGDDDGGDVDGAASDE